LLADVNTCLSAGKEIETKVRISMVPEALAAVPFEEALETDEYFFTPETAEKGMLYLRIRTRDGRKELELKEITSIGDIYKADETRYELGAEYEALKFILGRVLPVDITVKKVRKTYVFNDCKVTVDDVEGIGLYLEVEGPEAMIPETIAKLRVDPADVDTDGGYAQMMLKKQGLPHIPPRRR
jgi:adenylate cyclase class IV